MADYIGVRCPVCNKKFDQPDDIVVCPICGAPHHRECYAQKGECVFVTGHISGNVWRSPYEADQEQSAEALKVCPRCNTEIQKDAIFCPVCGQNVSAQSQGGGAPFTGRVTGWELPGMEYVNNPLYTVYGGVNPDDQIEEESVRDMAAYVGASSAYYVPRFKEMSERGRTISPNFAALFFSFFYYFYRKMYVMGVVVFALYVISSIPGYIYAKESLPIVVQQLEITWLFEQAGIQVPSAESVNMDTLAYYQNLKNLSNLINFAIVAILSLCCNRLYYEKCVKAVKSIRKNVGTDEKDSSKSYRSALMHLGGVSKIAPAVAVAAYLVVYFIAVGIIYS